MNYILTEEQVKTIGDSVIKIPYRHFNHSWTMVQKFISKRNYPPYILVGKIDLDGYDIEDLGSLVKVEGSLLLSNTTIRSLGDLLEVTGFLDLYGTKIRDLGNLQLVGGDLDLRKTPFSLITGYDKTKLYIEIKKIVNGDLYI